MFLPATKEEMKKLGWDSLDVVIVTGDAYIDSSYIGAAVIGKVLLKAGYRTGIIAQPDINWEDIARLGEPELFWGVTSGCVDSMVANYTASGKKRMRDDMTPGGLNNRRPDRAVIVYTNLIRKYFKNTKPVILGGIEASLRRITHYDCWEDKLRRPVLFDAKADILIYGMGEKAVLELAQKLKKGEDFRDIRGLCFIAGEKDGILKTKIQEDYISLPSFEEVLDNKDKFTQMFKVFYQNNDPLTAKGLYQKIGNRFLVQNPPANHLSQNELDGIYNLDFERKAHPYRNKEGEVRAVETIRFSITTHRGCYGECNFCSIGIHQGRTVIDRSIDSILREALEISKNPDFKGYILDVGGPTANMYGIECLKKLKTGSCRDKRCLFPDVCEHLKPSHKKQIELLRNIRALNRKSNKCAAIKKVFVASGIRYDLLLSDREYGLSYLKELVEHHVSGQLKIAPEHSVDGVLMKMGKPANRKLIEFKKKFDEFNKQAGKKQFLTYYFLAAHPGCYQDDMQKLREFSSKELLICPEQVQIFMPTPSTFSTLMYYTEKDPFTGEKLFVEKGLKQKEKQKKTLVSKISNDFRKK